MRMYDCTVRLNGDTSSEVLKLGVTAPEIIVLRHIHGADAVVRIIPKTQHRASHSEERDRLVRLYEGAKEHKQGMILHLFGPPHIPLMEELDPATEASMQAATDAADAAEVAKKAEIDAEVNRLLKIKLDAMQEVAVEETEKTEVVNATANNGRLSDEEIEAREKKRAIAMAAKKAERAKAGEDRASA